MIGLGAVEGRFYAASDCELRGEMGFAQFEKVMELDVTLALALLPGPAPREKGFFAIAKISIDIFRPFDLCLRLCGQWTDFSSSQKGQRHAS